MIAEYQEQFNRLIAEADKLNKKYELSGTVPEDYFEPGNMEYLEQYFGEYNPEKGILLLRFEVKGTRYEGHTEQIEKVKAGDPLTIVREPENTYNSNNFTLFTAKGINVGNMPAELCNAIAPLYDEGLLTINEIKASYVEPISKRSRHAKQAVLFAEITMTVKNMG